MPVFNLLAMIFLFLFWICSFFIAVYILLRKSSLNDVPWITNEHHFEKERNTATICLDFDFDFCKVLKNSFSMWAFIACVPYRNLLKMCEDPPPPYEAEDDGATSTHADNRVHVAIV